MKPMTRLLFVLLGFYYLSGCSSDASGDNASSSSSALPLVIGNGATSLQPGDSTLIEWEVTADQPSRVSIEVSYDGGSTWTVIETNIINIGEYLFAVPNQPGATFRLQVVAEDGSDTIIASSGDISISDDHSDSDNANEDSDPLNTVSGYLSFSNLSVQKTDEHLSFSDVPSGRWISFYATVDDQPVSNLSCDSPLPENTIIDSGRLHLLVPKTTDSIQYTCEADGQGLELQLDIKESRFAVASSSRTLAMPHLGVSQVRVSGNGQYLFFRTNQIHSSSVAQVYRKNLETEEIELVSGIDSETPASLLTWLVDISTDGRYVLFRTYALEMTGGNPVEQLVRKDMNNPDTAPVIATSLNSTLPDQSSVGASIDVSEGEMSSNGRWVSFATPSSHFLSGALEQQIFLKDMDNPALPPVMASTKNTAAPDQSSDSAANGCEGGAVSDDGRFVVFTCSDPNFSTTDGEAQVFLKDMSIPNSIPVTVSSTDSTQSNQIGLESGSSAYPVGISPDGRYVAFKSESNNLVTGLSGAELVFIKDMNNPTSPPRVANSLDSTQPDQTSFADDSGVSQVTFSDQWNWMLFSSSSTRFATGITRTQVYKVDLNNPSSPPQIISSLDPTQSDQTNFAANGDSWLGSVSDDGSKVFLETEGTNLFTAGTSHELLLYDESEIPAKPRLYYPYNQNLVDREPIKQSTSIVYNQTISGDGNYILFHSNTTNELGQGAWGAQDYRKNLQDLASPPEVASSLDSTQPNQLNLAQGSENYTARNPRMGHDGRWVVFESYWTNFAAGINQYQIFLKDMDNPENAPKIVSSADSMQVDQTTHSANDLTSYPHVSTDGRWVVFLSEASNFVTGAGGTNQVFRKDMNNLSSPPIIVSSTDSTEANQAAFQADDRAWAYPLISDDGRWVVFAARASNFGTNVGTLTQIYLKDMDNLDAAPIPISSRNSLAADQSGQISDAHCFSPTISADGRWIAFASTATNLVTGASGTQIYLKDRSDLGAPPKVISSLDSTQIDQTGQIGSSASDQPYISQNGEWIVFRSSAPNFATGINSTQIFRKKLDQLEQPPELISTTDPTHSDQTEAIANAGAGTPSISNSGKVSFISSSTNLVDGISDSQVYVTAD